MTTKYDVRTGTAADGLWADMRNEAKHLLYFLDASDHYRDVIGFDVEIVLDSVQDLHKMAAALRRYHKEQQ